MRQQGATLLQMMTTLALIGVLLQLGAPAYATFTADLHQAAIARDLAQTLRTARSHAMLQNQAVLVRPLKEDWGQGWRMQLAHGGQILREHRQLRPVHIVANMRQVTFSGLGIPLRGNGAFFGGALQLCPQNKGASHHQVVLAPSGRVSLRAEAVAPPGCASG
ncbi:GspH/FimT family pseudopilin [Pseudomonas sp. NPDC089554]|uniref:GspH/FimT family pseudopilin n=1 Tax=Pseudomonas sp. NPDC089554 TaxID=3390653 RepID=UPI003CFCFE8F